MQVLIGDYWISIHLNVKSFPISNPWLEFEFDKVQLEWKRGKK